MQTYSNNMIHVQLLCARTTCSRMCVGRPRKTTDENARAAGHLKGFGASGRVWGPLRRSDAQLLAGNCLELAFWAGSALSGRSSRRQAVLAVALAPIHRKDECRGVLKG